MATSDMTVEVRIQITLDGEPITRVLEAPATFAGMDGSGKPLRLFLALDGRKFAQALNPQVAEVRDGLDAWAGRIQQLEEWADRTQNRVDNIIGRLWALERLTEGE